MERQSQGGTSKHVHGGAVVVVAILGQTQILLIKETTKPLPHYWKLISETVEPGEPILNAVWGGVREEGGFEMKAEYDTGGKVIKITDPNVVQVKELNQREWGEGRIPHWRHFWGVVTTDHVISRLSGKRLSGGPDEKIETLSFPLARISSIPDLLRQHAEM